jgi:hypothetical protein
VKYLVRSGADLSAKNAAGKTPREEVEIVTSIKGTQAGASGSDDLDPDYYKTVSYLVEREDKDDESNGKPLLSISGINTIIKRSACFKFVRSLNSYSFI